MSAHESVNILLVDDQPAKLLSYEAVLAELGENLIKASSAREALDHLLRTDIALVLVDVCMPELDGFELAALIREHPRFQKTAIIFISAILLTDLDRLKGYQYGAVDYVPVPVVPEILRAKVSIFAELYRKTRQLEQMNHQLEERVAERTAELQASMTRLSASEEALKDADRRKDEFLAMLAHELRNPLAPVRNAVEIMRTRAPGDPELRWCRDVIERQVDQLTRLVDDLLDVSRITRGSIRLQLAPVDLATVVTGAVETSRPLIDARRHQLSVELPADPVRIEGDLARLTQVVANLLNNAAKYQEEGGQIRLQVESDGQEAVIRVRDHGMGIPPEMLAKVFDLFSQLEGTVDRAQGGLGIGLSLVKNLVEMHRGRVEALSEGRGLGTEVVVRLPCLASGIGAGAGAEAGVAAEAPRPCLSILVVDDNQDGAESMARLLRRAGHGVQVAYDGREALEMATAGRPAVVLLDIGLPEMDGYQVCQRLRQEGLSGALIVAMSGYGQDEDRRRSQQAGFDHHLVKPVSPTELLALLHR